MNTSVILEIEYLNKLSDSKRVAPEKIISSLGFNIVASEKMKGVRSQQSTNKDVKILKRM